MNVTFNGVPLETVLREESSKPTVGYVADGTLMRIVEGYPHVELPGPKGTTYKAVLVENVNPVFREKSNDMRRRIVERAGADRELGRIKVRIVEAPPGLGERLYKAVCVATPDSLAELDGFTAVRAHDVVASDRVFYARCMERKVEERIHPDDPDPYEETVFRMLCYGSSLDKMGGFLKPSNFRNRPSWECDVSEKVLKSETRVSVDFLEGSENFGFLGLEAKEHALVRLVGDNSNMGKKTVTHFFEPVISLRPSDNAIDMYRNETMVTRVVGPNAEPRIWDFLRGDTLENLPILTSFKTEKLGVVGVGYVPNVLRGTLRPNFYLKRVFMIGGEDKVGGLVREAKIRSNGNVIIADRYK